MGPVLMLWESAREIEYTEPALKEHTKTNACGTFREQLKKVLIKHWIYWAEEFEEKIAGESMWARR